MKKTCLLLSFLISCSLFSQDLYDKNVVTTIDITFTESNWDAILDQYYADGEEERLLATVVINGQTFEGAGVKYKGNSTYGASNAKNPINIKLDYTFEQDYQGYNTLKLANGKMDPSWVREPLTYEITRKYMPAPKSNFAWVTINGADYGLMCSSESVNSAFIDSHFYGDNDNTFFKCNPVSVMGGNVTPGCSASNNCSMQYLGTDTACYYNYYEVESDAGWADLRDFTSELVNNFDAQDDFMDRDRFIWMLAVNNVMVNLDSYTGPFVQNYYLYKDDFGIFNPVMWDFNMSFGSFRMMNNGGGGGGGQPTDTQLQQMDPFLRSSSATWPMLYKVFADPTLRRMYTAHCKTILEENFLNDLYIERANALQATVNELVAGDPNDFYTHANFISNLNATVNTGGGGGGGGMSNVIGITALMEAREDFMMAYTEFSAQAPVISSIDAATNVAPGTSATINATISGSSWVMLGWRKNEYEHFTHEEMFDDGLHNDGTAGDGVFGFAVSIPMGGIQYFIYAENDAAGIFSPARAEKEFYNIGSTGGLVLNEFQSNNYSTAEDGSGDHSDWIELYNSTSSSIDLSEYFLSDELDNPQKFQLPAVELAPGEYYIVWCDEEQEEGVNHANFKLPSEGGETITLADMQLNIVDLAFLPSQETDATFGRYPNGNGPQVVLTPTFENANSAIISVDELTTPLSFSVYPNPASDVIRILSDDSSASVRVLDMMGKVVLSQKVLSMGNVQVDISSLAGGAYLVEYGGATKSFIKL